ncbi:MAG: LysM peptidoglycan-binding domain-containing protein [Thermoflexales bacterium]|nr:LysM peptidoglycan-binding domain-containing protein [Thermoflexales bacterium]
MRFQSFARFFAIGVIAAVGLLGLSLDREGRSAQAQTAATATPRSTSTPIASGALTYTVKSGDSFNAIARRFNLTPQQLQAFNAITNTSVIRVGQVLIVAVSTFTPTPVPTDTPAPTSTATPTETPTPVPTATATVEPTATATRQPAVVEPPATIVAPEAVTPPASTGIPLDVIVVGAVMLFAVIGIFIGFRTQRA